MDISLKKLLEKKIGAIDLTKQLDDFVKFRIPTGLRGIDLIIGGGIPAARLTEIYGDFTTGKSRLLYHILAICQKMGGYAILLDQERGYSSGLADLAELDHTKLIYVDPDKIITIEDIFECIKVSINLLRENDPECLIAIGWDSVAMGVTLEDLEAKSLSVATSAARRAKVIGDGIRKLMPIVYKNKICLIFINQIRDKIGVLYGEKIDTVGGKMIKFAASLRLHCYLAGKIKDEYGIVHGFKGRLVVDKSKVCRPFEYCEFEMPVDAAISPYSGLLGTLVRRGEIIDLGRRKYKWGEVEFHEDEFVNLYKNGEALTQSGVEKNDEEKKEIVIETQQVVNEHAEEIIEKKTRRKHKSEPEEQKQEEESLKIDEEKEKMRTEVQKEEGFKTEEKKEKRNIEDF